MALCSTVVCLALVWLMATPAQMLEQANGSIQVYYHVFATGDWREIVSDQVTKISFSGLYDMADSINCFVLADDHHTIRKVSSLFADWGEKYKVRATDVDNSSYERFTLLKMQEMMAPDEKALYLHSKGVTYDKNDRHALNVYWWRTYLEYFLIKEHATCVKLLDHYDSVGVNLKELAGNHYSGNFWWVRGDYFKTLPTSIGDDYLAPEHYLLQNHPNITKAYSLWQSPIDHYAGAYLPKEFVDSLPEW